MRAYLRHFFLCVWHNICILDCMRITKIIKYEEIIITKPHHLERDASV